MKIAASCFNLVMKQIGVIFYAQLIAFSENKNKRFRIDPTPPVASQALHIVCLIKNNRVRWRKNSSLCNTRCRDAYYLYF